MRILTVEKLSKHFGGLMALNNLDFHIDEGEIVGVIGPNGSGKTTFLNLLTGFLNPIPGVSPLGEKKLSDYPATRYATKVLPELSNCANHSWTSPLYRM